MEMFTRPMIAAGRNQSSVHLFSPRTANSFGAVANTIDAAADGPRKRSDLAEATPIFGPTTAQQAIRRFSAVSTRSIKAAACSGGWKMELEFSLTQCQPEMSLSFVLQRLRCTT